MRVVQHREGGASAPSDPRSIVALAADYRAAFEHWGRLLKRHSAIEERLIAIQDGRGVVVHLRERASLRRLQKLEDRAKSIADAALDACDVIERQAARTVPEDLAELRASAALFAFIDGEDGFVGAFTEGSVEEWCRSLAAGILKLVRS